jgi:hypothetical protein
MEQVSNEMQRLFFLIARLIFMAGEARRGDIFLSPECNSAHARALARDERVIAALTPLVS